MTEETVYICDKLKDLDDVKPSTKPCRKAVTDEGGVSVILRVLYIDEGNEAHDDMQEVKFCGPRCGNFWLKRQRVD
jgi:hypothetical protein